MSSCEEIQAANSESGQIANQPETETSEAALTDGVLAATIVYLGFSAAYPDAIKGITEDEADTIQVLVDTKNGALSVSGLQDALHEGSCIQFVDVAADGSTKVVLAGTALADSEMNSPRWVNRKVLLEGIERGLKMLLQLTAEAINGSAMTDSTALISVCDEILQFQELPGCVGQFVVPEHFEELAAAVRLLGSIEVIAATPENLKDALGTAEVRGLFGL